MSCRLNIADLPRDIIGADRGFNVGGDVLTTLADGRSLDSVWTELQDALKAWNDGRSAVAALFTTNTTDSYDLLPLDGGRVDLEVASEFGVPVAGRVEPKYYAVGHDLKWYDFATRYTRKFLRDAKTPQIQSQHIAAQEGDNRLIFNSIMATLMTPSGGAFPARGTNPEGQTIYSLYAGAADDKPPTAPDGTTFAANHTHFLVSGGATVDSGDLDDVIAKVTEHGRGTKESGEQMVVLVHKQEGDKIRAFRVADGDRYDFIATANEPAYLTDQTLVGERPPATFNGLDVLGSYGNALIVEHTLAKAGYMVAVAAGGENPVAFRQHPIADNQGFRLVQGPLARYPLIESIYERGFGLGIRRRDAAAVIQIKASGTYTAPSWT
ncbi:hypothetical protein MK786_01080 [Microbacterium sp. CFH 31415]|uniref:hypothetical protein n=1 Tax=Microbacterium sp. CFH 31415 TaxID=2921732 RepID=UPI001F13371C|nr:hypothetical protein [Microbacterium sp. CFH 31415]MCH6229332.1 hypothetical protein [Microbacterium sp. CFH 31415]